jgi:heterodisulfide reductase subunit C/nitrate reductase gamma subunit
MPSPNTIASIALAICLAGVLWRIRRWLRSPIGPENEGLSFGRRLGAALHVFGKVLCSKRIYRITASFLWETLFLGHLLRRHPWRWAAHMAVCYGFLALVVFHALDGWTAPLFFADYAPTHNPFRWLRNLLAAVVLAGILVAVARRWRTPLKIARSPGDRFLLLSVAVIIVSGVLLESVQILSPAVFQDMVEDYMGDDDPREVAALQDYWAAEMGALPQAHDIIVPDNVLAAGRELHESYCADCHSRPQAAFLSYPVSRLVKPAMIALRDHRADLWLWHLHFWAACLALACLPFSKFFHLVATPLNLLARAAGPAAAIPALRPMRRALALDACTHCAICSQHCSVAPIYKVIPNPTILPSEKLRAVKHGQTPSNSVDELLAEGSFICTLCGRCTQWCPSGIDLQDLWQATRRDLIEGGKAPTPGGSTASPLLTPVVDAPVSLGLSDRPETFWACVQCTTCTSVCPVVAASDDPQGDLDLTPQQIMNLMRLQLRDQALGSRMLWDCVTCYKCQEHCPQDVKVADILYELRNAAWRQGRPGSQTEGRSV